MGTELVRCGKSSKMVVAAVPAPADTPMVPGSASGLRITDCNSAPEADSEAPMSSASSSRGRRRLKMMTLMVLSSPLNTARRISPREYPALPTETATSDSAAIRSSRNSQMLPTFRALKPRFCDVLFMGRLIARSAKAPGRQDRRCYPPR